MYVQHKPNTNHTLSVCSTKTNTNTNTNTNGHGHGCLRGVLYMYDM